MPMENGARTKWNADNYKQLKIYADPELAEAFKAACAAGGVSMASVLSEAMAAYCGKAQQHPDIAAPEYTTRSQRRKAVKQIIGQLETAMEAEAEYKDNIPENLRSGPAYESAEETVSLLEAAISVLSEAF